MSQNFSIVFIFTLAVVARTVTPVARIVGGNVVDISKHPYLASVRVKSCSDCVYEHKCGGSIYSDKVIITAAQCILGLGTKDRLMVVVGANSRAGADGVQMPVAKTIAHEGYNFWTIDNDIGLVMLNDALPLNEYNIKAIDVASTPPRAGRASVVSGWGWNAEDGEPTFFLEDADVQIISNAQCEEVYGAGEVTENMICAGVWSGGKDGCQGDTGGPLVTDGHLVGLVSWGRGCGRAGYPGVYTNVASHTKWIADKIGEQEKFE